MPVNKLMQYQSRVVLFFLVLMALFGAPASVAQERPRHHGGASAEAPWVAMLERLGLSTETEDLPGIALGHPQLVSRYTALRLLLFRRDPEQVIPLIYRLLEEDLPYASFVAYLDSLGSDQGQRWREDGEVPPLIRHFRQDVAILLLRTDEREKGLGYLDRFEQQEDDLDRLRAMALGRARIGDFSRYRHIVAAARSDQVSIRRWAVADLAELARMEPGPEATAGERPTDLLKVLATDDETRIRRAAVFEVAAWRPGGADGAQWRKILKKLASGDADEEVRRTAKRALDDYRKLEESHR